MKRFLHVDFGASPLLVRRPATYPGQSKHVKTCFPGLVTD
jgi:hypothetical protein